MRFDQLSLWYRHLRYRERPMPRIEVRAGRLLPAAVVRLAAVIAVTACVVLAGGVAALPVGLTACLGAGFCLWTLWRPDYAVGVAALCVAAFLLAISPSAPLHPMTPAIVLTGYLGLRLAMVAQLVPWRGRVAPAAVFNWRDALIIALTGVAGAAALLPGAGAWPVVIGLWC